MWGQPISLTKGYPNNFPGVLYTKTTYVISNNVNYIRIYPYSFPHTHISVVLPSRTCFPRIKPIPKSSNIDASNNEFEDNGEQQQQQSNSTGEILKRLKKYGMSGVLSYGLLNTAYYLPTFLFVWLYVAPPAPGKMGYIASVERFLKTFAMVWAGSQVTKIGRAMGALAFAPVVDKGLSWFTVKFKFESKGKAFMVIVGFCFGLAFFMFLLLTLLWA